jgi:hypothetical protein
MGGLSRRHGGAIRLCNLPRAEYTSGSFSAGELASHPSNRFQQKLLKHAAFILGSTRLLLTWKEEAQQGLWLASYSRNSFQFTREPSTLYQSLMSETLINVSFFCLDARSPRTSVVCVSPLGLQRWEGSPLNKKFLERFSVKSVLALKLPREGPEGYLFVLDKRRITTDDFTLRLGSILSN